MSTQDNHTHDALADDPQLRSADGEGAVDETALSLSELNQFLGKDFKDVESAKKGLKDTFSYVGKKKEDIEKEVRASLTGAAQAGSSPDLASEVNSLKERVFYSENPQYKGYEGIIRKMGSNPAEVVDSEEFKTVFENGKVAGEVAQKNSVVHSNSRLSQNTTYTQEAVTTANATRSTGATADVLAKAILGELEG